MDKMPSSYNLTPELEADLEALIRAGLYANRSEVIRDAVRTLLEHLPPHARVRAAVELYRRGDITVSRAADLAGLPFIDMRKILVDERLLQFQEVSREERRRRGGRLSKHIQ